MEGIFSVQDSYIYKFSLLHNKKALRHWSIVSMAVTVMTCSLISIYFGLSPQLIPYYLTEVNSTVTSKAMQHVLLLLPGFWFHSLYAATQRYHQVRLTNEQRGRTNRPKRRNFWHVSIWLYDQLWEKGSDIRFHSHLVIGSVLGILCNLLGKKPFLPRT